MYKYESDTPYIGLCTPYYSTRCQGEEPTEMGKFINVFCFENEPYECEFVYHDAIMVHEGEFKCQICDEDGERQDPGTDDFLR